MAELVVPAGWYLCTYLRETRISLLPFSEKTSDTRNVGPPNGSLGPWVTIVTLILSFLIFSDLMTTRSPSSADAILVQ